MSYIIKIESIFLAVILTVLTVISAPFLKPQAATTATVYIEGTGVGIRSTPSSANSNNLIERVSYISGTLLEEVKISDSETWLKISYVKDGVTKEGYVFNNPEWISVVYYDPDADFETKLAAFPESYREGLRVLHARYPNWEFIPDNINITFNEAVYQQTLYLRKLVHLTSQPVSWRSMGLGSYNWNTGEWTNTQGGWTGASKEIIAYYMDPRNFLNSSEIFMFMQQSYNSAIQNEEGVNKIIAGTFMEAGYTPAAGEPYGGSYAKVIMAAAQESGVSPYVIAAKIKQEQGVNGSSSLISGTRPGYEGYYNFFNVRATGSNSEEVIINGLAYAYNNSWNTRYASIVGGAKFLGSNYINKGQDTSYYQDFNVRGNGSHQYAQAVHDAYNQGVSLAKNYQDNTDIALSFKIPVYTGMETTAYPKPASSNSLNNYYLSEISVSGLTPSFNMFTNEYNLAVVGNTAIKVVPVSGASLVSPSEYALKAGNNTVVISVLSEAGNYNYYVIYVNSAADCTLYVNSTGTLPDGVASAIIGDVNGDGNVNIIDLARVQMHILGVKLLAGAAINIGDINGDGNVNIIDLARIQMHILGVKPIGQ